MTSYPSCWRRCAAVSWLVVTAFSSIIAGMVTGAAINFIDEFWQLYLVELHIPIVYFGLFSASLYVLGLPGNLLAHVLKSRFRYRILLLCVSGVFAAGFLYVSMVDQGYIGLAAIFATGLFSSIVEPLASGYLHHRIDSTMRATLDSFQSLGLNAVLIMTGLGFGYFSSRFDIFGGYGFVAFVCGVFFVYLLVGAGRIEE